MLGVGKSKRRRRWKLNVFLTVSNGSSTFFGGGMQSRVRAPDNQHVRILQNKGSGVWSKCAAVFVWQYLAHAVEFGAGLSNELEAGGETRVPGNTSRFPARFESSGRGCGRQFHTGAEKGQHRHDRASEQSRVAVVRCW